MKRWALVSSTVAIGFVCAGYAYAADPALPAASAAPKAIATADGETSGIRLEVTQLKRVGSDAVMVKFTVYNDSDKQYSGNEFHEKEYSTADGVYLVDLDGKKKYEVVKDSDAHCVCSRDIKSIGPHMSAVLWAKFGAPPETTIKVGVVVPHFTPMDDVPLSH